jgi:pyruvate-formate lyase-activating enzyme
VSAAGLHWFDRRSGLNVFLPSLAVPRSLHSPAPRYVSIALTNACDLHCPYCYAPKSPARLDRDRLLGWIRELDLGGCLGIGFGGGEPLIFPGFAALCGVVATETSLAVTFTTHGHRLSGAVARQLLGYVHFIRVSVDGVATTYQQLRGRSFDAIRKQLDLARSISRLGLNVVVNERTVRELDAVARLAVDSGAEELLLLPQRRPDGSLAIGAETQIALDEWAASYRGTLRLTAAAGGLGPDVPIADPFAEDRHWNRLAHILATGIVKRDAFAASGVSIGDSLMAALRELQETA